MKDTAKLKSILIENALTQLGISAKDSKNKFVCPVCQSGSKQNKTSGFSINKESNTWKCFSCSLGGDVIELVSKVKDCNFKEACSFLEQNFPAYSGGSITSTFSEAPSPSSKFEQTKHAIKQNDNSPALDYLRNVRQVDIANSMRSHIYYDSHRHSVVFLDKKEHLINYRGIDKPDKGNAKESILKNAVFDKTFKKENATVYLTEGVINALTLHSIGFSAIALFSTSNKVDSADKLKQYLDGKNIILAFDPDTAGGKYGQFWMKLLASSNIRYLSVSVLNLPNEKDVNDLHISGDLESFLSEKSNKTVIDNERLITVSDIQSIYEPILENDGQLKDIKIHYSNLSEIFRKLGYTRMSLDSNNIYVKNRNNVLSIVTPLMMQDDFLNIIEKMPDEIGDEVSRDFLLEKFYRNPGQYFSEPRFSLLRAKEEIKFVKDTKNVAYLFFINAFVKITDQEVKAYPYTALHGKIWKEQIIDHEIHIETDESKRAVFEKFLWNVAGKDKKRYFSLLSIIGYVSHSYYDGKLKAIILTDSSLKEGADGRSGKTLFAKSLGYCKVYVELNGKDFDPSKQFKFQSLTLDTEIVHLNDVKKSFQFEPLFNDITEGISIEKKGKAPIHINAKIILSTNKTISLEGGSARDRAFEFEFSDHYSEKFSPEDEFKHWFFRDWDKAEFNNFYNLFFRCIQLYLKEGLLKAPTINLELRKLVESTNKDFVSFMKEAVESGLITIGKESNKKELHEAFLTNYEEYAQGHKYQHQRNFTAAMHIWAEFYPGVSREVKERSSGKNQYILFQKEQQ